MPTASAQGDQIPGQHDHRRRPDVHAPWRWTPTAASWSSGRARARTATAGASTDNGSTPPATPWGRSSRSTRPPPATRCSPGWPWTAAGTSPSSGKARARTAAGTSTDSGSTPPATPSGSEFQVNTTTAGDQYNANIGMNASGDFVVSWTSDGQDGQGQGIFAKQYNADGSVDPTYTVTGCGSDIWGNSDQFNYASTEVTGDVTMIATVDFGHRHRHLRQVRRDVPRQPGSGRRACDDLCQPRQSRRLPVAQLADGAGLLRRVLARRHHRHGYGQARPRPATTSADTTARRRRHMDTVGTTQTIAMGDTIQAGLAVSSWNANAPALHLQERDDQRQQGFHLDRPRHRLAEHRRILRVQRRVPGRRRPTTTSTPSPARERHRRDFRPGQFRLHRTSPATRR